MKILLVGNAPLPDENTSSRPAAGLRTHQFMQALGGAGQLKSFLVAMPECYEGELPHDDEKVVRAWKSDRNLRKKLQNVHDKFQPDAIVSVNTYPSMLASGLRSEASLWADLNGWIMAEGQAQAAKLETNDYLPHYWRMERAVLERADKFSTVSGAQRTAAIGELASLGRLGKETFEYQFVETVRNATEWLDGEKVKARRRLEGVPERAFILLWLGGYNTWVDEEMLFHGLEKAMARDRDLYFVSTGGEILGLDNRTFANFKGMVDKSKYRDRFVFLGWVETEEIPYIYKECNVGLNIDKACLETEMGARNRINEMMKFGLPVITTLGSEISYLAAESGGALGVKHGDHEGFAKAIKEITESDVAEMGRKAQEYIAAHHSYGKTCEKLVEWVEAGAPKAPDRGMRVKYGIGGKLRAGWRYFRERGLKATLKKLF